MLKISKKIMLSVILIMFLTTCSGYAEETAAANFAANTFIPAAPNVNVKSYILIDAQTGTVLVEKNSNLHLPPASLTKIMSLYIISKALKSGSITWQDSVRISKKAWKAEGSRMFVKVNDKVSVKELVQGIITASGNDATIAMAEYLGGSEETFTQLMNQEAKNLGMNDSNFTDSTGLPNLAHYATARDLAQLSQAYIVNFPEYYPLFSEKWFSYNKIKQANRNRLLWRYPYADGLKTGYTAAAGFCLIGTAQKDNMRLISVIMGAPTDEARTEAAIQLLNYGFRFYASHKLYHAQETITHAQVWQGSRNTVALGPQHDVYVTLPNNVQITQLKTQLILPNNLVAPCARNQEYGKLNLLLNDKIITTVALIALNDVPRGNWWQRKVDSFLSIFHHKLDPETPPINQV